MSETEETAPSCDSISHHIIPTERVGALSVWVQGDLSLAQNKDTRDTVCVFMTIHDVGSNHHAWLRFANSPAMAEIREKAVFLHVDLLGQEDGADEIKSFPSMQEIGEDLVNILDTLRVKVVIGLGEGAGANIMLRFGAMHVTRCLGVVCINPNEVAMSMLDSLMDRVKNIRVGSKPLTSDQKQMNQNNVAKFAGAFLNRSDVIPIIEKSLNCETMLLAGAKAESQVKGMETIFGYCDKSKTSMLKVDDVANIMEEAPGKLANSILLFSKGLGWLTSLSLPNVSRRSSRDSTGGRRMSMEEYDKPNIRRLSLTGSTPPIN
jgi:hypothetical protein